MSHEPVILACPGTRLQNMTSPRSPATSREQRHQRELRARSRRQWGSTKAAKRTNQSLSKPQTPITANSHLCSSLLKFKGIRKLQQPVRPSPEPPTPQHQSHNHSYLDRLMDDKPTTSTRPCTIKELTPQGKNQITKTLTAEMLATLAVTGNEDEGRLQQPKTTLTRTSVRH